MKHGAKANPPFSACPQCCTHYDTAPYRDGAPGGAPLLAPNLGRLWARPRSSAPTQAPLLVFFRKVYKNCCTLPEIAGWDRTATGGGGSLLAFSPFLVLKLLIRWAGKWASKVWTHSVSECIFPFTAPRGLIRCFLDDSVWRIGSG